MTKYRVRVSQAQGEYSGDVIIKCNRIEQIDSNVILADGVEIFFQGEDIEKITKADDEDGGV